MATSNITNTILDPSGTAVEGVLVVCRLMPTAGFREDTGAEVARVEQTVTDSNGAYTLTLERNANITPDNTWYQITELIPDSKGGKRVWNVSVGASNQTVLAALISPLPEASAGTFLTQAAADARYQALGSLGSSVTTTDLDGSASGTAGVSTSAARSDHKHVAENDAWTDYTPTLVQSGAVTKTVTYARYLRVGRMITVQIYLVVTGSGTSANTVVVGLPVAAASTSSMALPGTATIFDTSANTFYPGFPKLSSSGTDLVFTPAGASVGLGSQFLGLSSFTAGLASGDVVTCSAVYEAAS